MKKFFILIFCVLFFNYTYSLGPKEDVSLLSQDNDFNTEFTLNKSYQQFKFQVKNFELQPDYNYANLRRRRKKQDNTMLYVAGGLAVATGVLILTNNPENFTSNSSSSVNLGIAIGGTVACGLFLTKHFVDRGR